MHQIIALQFQLHLLCGMLLFMYICDVMLEFWARMTLAPIYNHSMVFELCETLIILALLDSDRS